MELSYAWRKLQSPRPPHHLTGRRPGLPPASPTFVRRTLFSLLRLRPVCFLLPPWLPAAIALSPAEPVLCMSCCCVCLRCRGLRFRTRVVELPRRPCMYPRGCSPCGRAPCFLLFPVLCPRRLPCSRCFFRSRRSPIPLPIPVSRREADRKSVV